MKRPLLVDQRENTKGDYWYVIRGGNRQVLSTSEMYPNRSNAIRAAKAFIALIDPVPVVFSYWTGDRQPRPSADGLVQALVTERVR